MIAGILRALARPDAPRRCVRSRPPAGCPRHSAPTGATSPPSARSRRCSPTGSGCPPSVRGLFVHLTERWDGKGEPAGFAGEDIPLPLRIVHVARDAAFQRLVGGDEHAARIVRERAGHAFDPAIATQLADDASAILALDANPPAWDEIIAARARPRLHRSGTRRSTGRSRLWATSPTSCPPTSSVTPSGVPSWPRRRRSVRLTGRARQPSAAQRSSTTSGGSPSRPDLAEARSTDTGRVGARSATRLPLGTRPRRSPFLSALRRSPRLTTSGSTVPAITADASPPSLEPTSRLLAAADAYHAMTEPRPHRAGALAAAGRATPSARKPGRPARRRRRRRGVGATGQQVPQFERPAGLTEREAEVVAW